MGNTYKIGYERIGMTSYRFRVWLHPNPPLEFEPETEVWRDIEVDGSHTLTDFHEAIFDAFERWDTHAYEFLLRDEHGISIRSYAHPQMYSGDQSWPPMDGEQIDRFLERAIPDDVSEEARDKFRDLRKNPPKERNAAETTIDDLDLVESQSMFYEFDFGDGWEHHIELEDIREGSLDDDPVVVDEHGDAPPQYPGHDE
jgi:hypothetical protein